MWPYWAVGAATLVICGVLRIVAAELRRPIVALLAILLGCFAGLRFETGWDWEAYDYFFANLHGMHLGAEPLALHNPFDFEWGFWWICYLLAAIGVRPYLGIAVITVSLILFSALRRLGWGICFFGVLYLYYGYFHNFSIIRQGLACAFFCLAISAIIDRKPMRFSAWVLAAWTVHQSSAALAPLYFLCGRRSPQRAVLLAIAASVPFVALPLMGWVPGLALPLIVGGDIGHKIAAYIESESVAFKVGFSLKYVELLLMLLISIVPSVESSSRSSLPMPRSLRDLIAPRPTAFDIFRNLTLVELAMYAIFNDISILYERFTVFFEFSHGVFAAMLAMSIRSAAGQFAAMLVAFALVAGRYYQLIESPPRVETEKSHHERFIPYRSIITHGGND